MGSLFEALIAAAATYPHAIGLLAFTAALLESVAILGLFVPGSIVLMALGALVPLGAIGLWPLMVWATAGALVGDFLSYGLGRRYHQDIRDLRMVRKRTHLLERGDAFFRHHGGKSIVLGRFFQGTRAIVPLVAGMADMPPRRFLTAALLAAAIWAPSTILPGVLFGATLNLAAAVSMRLAVVLVVFLVVLFAVVLLLRLLLRRGLPLALRLIQRSLAWAAREDGRLHRLVHAAVGRFRGEGWVVAVLGALAALSLWAFAVVLENVVAGEPLVLVDSAVYNLLLALRTGFVDRIMVAVTSLGDGIVVAALFVVVLAVLLGRGAWWAAGHWVAAIAGGVLFAAVTKMLLHTPRPFELELDVALFAYAFPSGHATNNVVLYGMLVLLVLPELGALGRILVTGAAALLVAGIALSRLYLGAHWLSDVLGGLTFALAWVAIVGASYFRRQRRPLLRPRWLLATVALTLLVVGGAHAAREHETALEVYAVRVLPRTLDAASWWREEWRSLPAGRIDLAGDVEEPLVLQWAGAPGELVRELAAAGYEPPPPWSLVGALAHLSPDATPSSLPVLPKLHDGRVPELGAIRASPDDPEARLVLRLWSAGAVLADGEGVEPLWQASLSRERLHRVPWLATWTEGEPAPPTAVEDLAPYLPHSRLAWREGEDGEIPVLLAAARQPPAAGTPWRAQSGRMTPFLSSKLP